MFLIDAIKSVQAIRKANKFIKEHEDTVNKVKNLVANVQKGINFLKDNRDDIQKAIDKAEVVVEKLKGIINK